FMHNTMVPVQVKTMKIQFQDKENSEDIFSFRSALEDFICVVFVPDRNIINNSYSEEFTRILKTPCQGVCVYTPDWPISSLQYVVDPHPDIYPPPQEDSSLIRDAIFYERTQTKTQKIKGIEIILDPFQMIVSELKIEFKKWEIILSENVVSLTGNKDHPNAYLCYMLYCLAIENPFNLAYYIANQMDKGKRPHLPTSTPPDSESSDSPSPTPHQWVENDPMDNYTLDPIPYTNQLPPIEGGNSLEFKQTKRMFKCLFHFLSKKK
ncbi:hypothetical protein Tco_1473282, partial [Tanacetum coccineum]